MPVSTQQSVAPGRRAVIVATNRTPFTKAFADLRDLSEPVTEPEAVSAVALVTESPPLALGTLKVQATKPSGARRVAFDLKPGEMRRAIILSEILGRPVSDRPRRV